MESNSGLKKVKHWKVIRNYFKIEFFLSELGIKVLTSTIYSVFILWCIDYRKYIIIQQVCKMATSVNSSYNTHWKFTSPIPPDPMYEKYEAPQRSNRVVKLRNPIPGDQSAGKNKNVLNVRNKFVRLSSIMFFGCFRWVYWRFHSTFI